MHRLLISPLRALSWIIALALAVPSHAHEFWIEPATSRAEVGAPGSADLRVGDMLSGQRFPWLGEQTEGARVHAPSGTREISGRDGDRPALSYALAEPGLHIVTYEAVPNYVVFDDLAEFAEALEYEGLRWVVAEHEARGLPSTEIAEGYIRNARALVQVGPPGPGDVDRLTGMPFELVVLGSPYLPGQAEVEVELTWQGEPQAGVQISVFRRPAGGTAPQDVVRTLVTTDEEGRASIPIAANGLYLLNAVHMEPVSGPGSVVWQSHWASLTFTVAPE